MRAIITANYWRAGEGNSSLQQTLPVAQALLERGHDVIYAVPAPLMPAVTAAGYRAVSAGSDEEFTQLQRRLDVTHLDPDKRSARYFSDILVGFCARAMARDVIGIGQNWGADIIIREDTELGGCLAAEALGLPHAAIKGTGLRPALAGFPGAALALDRQRAELGLPPDPEMAMLHRFLLLLPLPRRLYGQALPPTAHVVKPFLFTRQDAHPPADLALHVHPDRPTVYATSGNTFRRAPDVLGTIVEGMRSEPVNLIVTVGQDSDPAELGPQPSHVRVERWIPASFLYQLADLVVCHGGAATVAGALSYGVPLVIVPFAFDHPWNAQGCAASGAAVVVDEEERSPAAVRTAARTALADRSFRENAMRVRDEISASPGIEHAAALLERLARERLPLRGDIAND